MRNIPKARYSIANIVLLILTIGAHTMAQEQSAGSKKDSLLALYNNPNLPSDTRYQSLYTLINENYLFSQPDSAELLAKELISFCKENKLIEGQLKAQNVLAVTYGIRSKFESAIEAFKAIVSLSTTQQDQLSLASAYANIGKCYYELKSIYVSYEYFQKSLEYFQSYLNQCTGDKCQDAESAMLAVYNNQLGVLIDLKEYEQATIYADTLDRSISKINNVNTIVATHRNIASLDLQLGKYDSAKGRLKTHILNQEHIKDNTLQYAEVLHLMGEISLKQNEMDAAEDYFAESLSVREDINNVYGIIDASQSLAGLYMTDNQHDKAYDLLVKSKTLAEENQLDYELPEPYNLLSQYYQNINQPAKALEYNIKYHSLKDSLLQDQTNRLKLDIEERLKYQSEVESQQSSLLIEAQKLIATRRLLFISSVMTAFLALFSILLYKTYRRAKKYQRELKFKNLELQKNREIINEKNEALNARNEDLKNFAYVAAHDLKAPLRTIGNFSKLFERKYGDQIHEDDSAWLSFIIDDSKRLSKMVDNILSYSNIKTNLSDREVIDLNQVVDVVFKQLDELIASSQIKINYNIQELPKVESYYSMLLQLFMNIISNSIKFTQDSKQNIINIGWEEQDETTLKFYISDQGKGMAQESVTNIFEMFSKNDVSNNLSGSGIGLATCKSIVEFLGGEIYAESTLNQGTTIHFTMAIQKKEGDVYLIDDDNVDSIV